METKNRLLMLEYLAVLYILLFFLFLPCINKFISFRLDVFFPYLITFPFLFPPFHEGFAVMFLYPSSTGQLVYLLYFVCLY